jgi:hypothetical protein
MDHVRDAFSFARPRELRRERPISSTSSLFKVLNHGGAPMQEGPRFWALVLAIWIGLVLGVMNIAVKIDLFMSMAAKQ